MALRKTLNLTGQASIATEIGVVRRGEETVLMDSYIKVESVSGTKDSVSASVSFTDGSLRGTKEYTFKPAMDGENFIKQAYGYLKSLEEFSGAEDV
jgi:hypothetical protein